jgi:hypothetical protein
MIESLSVVIILGDVSTSRLGEQETRRRKQPNDQESCPKSASSRRDGFPADNLSIFHLRHNETDEPPQNALYYRRIVGLEGLIKAGTRETAQSRSCLRAWFLESGSIPGSIGEKAAFSNGQN